MVRRCRLSAPSFHGSFSLWPEWLSDLFMRPYTLVERNLNLPWIIGTFHTNSLSPKWQKLLLKELLLVLGGFPPNCHQTLYKLFFLNNALSTTLLSASLQLRIVGYEYIYYHHDDSRLVSATDISGETKRSVAPSGGSEDFVIYLVSQAWRSVLTYFTVIWKTAPVACVCGPWCALLNYCMHMMETW